jgi:hypothetical protein
MNFFCCKINGIHFVANGCLWDELKQNKEKGDRVYSATEDVVPSRAFKVDTCSRALLFPTFITK